ncbi:MAG: T9SS type A sorting domain-containing protein [Bacteroidia bacterium]|nr:T9SS type A sorting domain-containing protein [Bacteroidia bacterium]
MLKKHFLLFSFFLFLANLSAQNPPFNLSIESFNIQGLGGLQAYAFGQDSGRWVLIGGRLDGLHRRQPFAAFDVAGNNNQIFVVDPVAGIKWSTSLTSLSIELQEQLSSTNMEFHQEGRYLYILGGYGYNAHSASRKTFPNLIAVDVPLLINAIVNSTSISSAFRQVTDPKFAVTGGHLEMINDVFYLVGGNKFDGNYNPMGNPTYTQQYTNSIRKFKISDDGTNISITHLSELIDTANLHRRDYNAVAQILPNGSEGITAFSGVFQLNVDLPFLNCVNIDSLNYQVQSGFQQFYNHYHCPVVPIYAASGNQMHTVFFGGIAQFYDSAGILVQDDNVPFVKTIARITRLADGSMAEYKLPVEMPAFLGASAEFIRNENLEWYPNGVLKLDSIQQDSVLIGYIFGGIASSAKNIFFVNSGSQSQASSQIFKVYLFKNTESGLHQINKHSNDLYQISVYPNPNNGEFELHFTLNQLEPVEISLFNYLGELVYSAQVSDTVLGNNILNFDLNSLEYGGTYMLQIKTQSSIVTRKLILEY